MMEEVVAPQNLADKKKKHKSPAGPGAESWGGILDFPWEAVDQLNFHFHTC